MEAFVVEARPVGLRAGLDPARLHEVANDLEVDAFAITTRKLQEKLEK